MREPRLSWTAFVRSGGLSFGENSGLTVHFKLAALRRNLDQMNGIVAVAYGWPADLSNEQILERLLVLNLERAAEETKAAKVKKPKASREKKADEMI